MDRYPKARLLILFYHVGQSSRSARRINGEKAAVAVFQVRRSPAVASRKRSLSSFSDALSTNSPVPMVPASLILTTASSLRRFSFPRTSLTSSREIRKHVHSLASRARARARTRAHTHTRRSAYPFPATTRSIGVATPPIRALTLSFILYPFRPASVRPRSVISLLFPAVRHLRRPHLFPIPVSFAARPHLHRLRVSHTLSPLRSQLPAVAFPLISFRLFRYPARGDLPSPVLTCSQSRSLLRPSPLGSSHPFSERDPPSRSSWKLLSVR